jgi:succinate-acetate transporter protein
MLIISTQVNVTAIVACYASAAGVMNGHVGRQVFPVGKPLFNLGR